MDIKKYEILLKTVELGKLTHAAAALNYTQSGVSYILNELEKEWGLTLLSRSKTGVTPTMEGAHLLRFIRDVCEANQRLLNEIDSLHGLESGVVTIGTFTSVAVHILPSILKMYQTNYPNIVFRLMHGTYNEIKDWIRKGMVDIGFLDYLPEEAGIESILFGQDRLVAILPLDHPLAAHSSFPTLSLTEEPYILMEDGVDYFIRELFEKNGIPLNVQFTVKDDFEIIAMVESGLGISILPEMLLYRTGFNIAIRELDQPLVRQLCVGFQDKASLSRAAQHFLSSLFDSHWDWESNAPFIRISHEYKAKMSKNATNQKDKK